jgi:hypothetical protein
MNDIAHRLRESAKATFYDPLKSELNEAASHIEMLESALRKVLAYCYQYESGDVARIIRKALEEKDD